MFRERIPLGVFSLENGGLQSWAQDREKKSEDLLRQILR